MTIGEMHSEFERKLRNLDVVIDAPTSEISNIFYEALYKFIDKYYETFEEDERSRKALSLLTINDADVTITDASPQIVPNSYKATIPTDPELLYTVLELATIDSNVVMVKPITLDAYRTNLNNPFRKPWKNLVWRLDIIPNGDTKYHILVADSTAEITNYQLGYIKVPTKYTIEDDYDEEMEVPEIFQYEIIDMAIEMFLQSHNILNSNKQNV